MNGYLTAVVDVTDVQTVWMRVAMAMLHSLWIGVAIGVLALIVTLLLRTSRRRARYNVLVASLLFTAAGPVVVFFALAPETAMKTFEAVARRAPVEVPGRWVHTKPVEMPTADEVTNPATPPEPIKVVDEAGTVYVVPEVVTGEYAANDFTPVVREDALAARQRIVVSPKWIVLAYAAIAFALLLRLAIGIAGGSRLRRTSQLVTDGAVLSALARHTQSLGMRITPAIAYCARVAVPTVVGVVRPMILLPLSAATGMTPEQVEYLVLHELAHIRRYDHIVNLMQRVIEALLFYHPVVWLISRQIRIEREHCCDDLVVHLGGDAHHYAESLLAAATLAQGFSAHSAVPTLSATGKASHLRQRIARILGEPAPAVRLRHTGWMIATVFAFAGIVAIAQLNSAEKQNGVANVGSDEIGATTAPLATGEASASSNTTTSTRLRDNAELNQLADELVAAATQINGVEKAIYAWDSADDGADRLVLTLGTKPGVNADSMKSDLQKLYLHALYFTKEHSETRTDSTKPLDMDDFLKFEAIPSGSPGAHKEGPPAAAIPVPLDTMDYRAEETVEQPGNVEAAVREMEKLGKPFLYPLPESAASDTQKPDESAFVNDATPSESSGDVGSPTKTDPSTRPSGARIPTNRELDQFRAELDLAVRESELIREVKTSIVDDEKESYFLVEVTGKPGVDPKTLQSQLDILDKQFTTGLRQNSGYRIPLGESKFLEDNPFRFEILQTDQSQPSREKEEAEEIAAAINEAAEVITNKLDQIVHSLNAMTPEAAAKIIAAWPESEFKTIIGLMDEEVRKNILHEMDTQKSESIQSNRTVKEDEEPLPERILYDKNRVAKPVLTPTQ